MSYPDSCRLPPRPAQVVGTRALLGDSTRPFEGFALFDEVGVGKSKQVVDAVCERYTQADINAVIAVTPGFARSVWASPDPVLGEFAKHAWESVPYALSEYCARHDALPAVSSALPVLTTNYEFIRRDDRLDPLRAWARAHRTWLIVDESWAVKTHNSDQTKAVRRLRRECQYVVLLNGTPGKPEEVFAQFEIMDPRIIGVKNFWAFRARYCVMGGWMNKSIVKYQRMEEFAARTHPYALQRLAKDCLTLDEPIYLTLDAPLTPATWRLYKAMRDDCLAWLDSETETGAVSIAMQAGVRTMRLTQILAGFLGGVEEAADVTDPVHMVGTVREVGREKLDAVMAFLKARAVSKAIVWCRFRPEMARCAAAVTDVGWAALLLQGQQPPDDRERTKRAFAPGGTPASCSDVLVGHPAAGGAGLNFAAASLAIYMSNSWSLKDRKQSEGRVNRPGQTRAPVFVDVVATGPNGEKTVDHAMRDSLRANEDIANWTAATWRRALTE